MAHLQLIQPVHVSNLPKSGERRASVVLLSALERMYERRKKVLRSPVKFPLTIGFTVPNAVKAMGAKASVDLMAIGCTITVSQNQESIFCEQ